MSTSTTRFGTYGLQKINGNDNVSLQNIKDSTINLTIQKIDEETKELIQVFNSFIEEKNEHRKLNVFVVTSTKEQVEGNSELEFAPLKDSILAMYGEKAMEWKPFFNECINEILVEFAKESRLELQVMYFAKVDFKLDELEEDFFKHEIASKAILIVDPLSLYFEENHNFAELFESEAGPGTGPGGLIVIIPQIPADLSLDFINLIKRNHSQSHEKFYRKFFRPCVNLELDVTNPALLKRRLSNIALACLNKVPDKSTVFGSVKDKLVDKAGGIEVINSTSNVIQPKK